MDIQKLIPASVDLFTITIVLLSAVPYWLAVDFLLFHFIKMYKL